MGNSALRWTTRLRTCGFLRETLRARAFVRRAKRTTDLLIPGLWSERIVVPAEGTADFNGDEGGTLTGGLQAERSAPPLGLAVRRVLVADPLRVFCAGVRNVLQRERDFEVVEAATLDEVFAAIDERCPEIALIDLDLPPVGGVAAVRQLSRRCSAYTIVLSIEPSRDAVLSAVRAGAHGFLHKEIAPEGLVRALRGVAQGEAPLSRDLATLMIDALHGLDERSRARMRVDELSNREREVLDLVAQGARNKQIAATLAISEFTAKRHVQNILKKLDLPSRQAAATFYASANAEESQPAEMRTG